MCQNFLRGKFMDKIFSIPKVYVHRNLIKNCWSITVKGKVQAHTEAVILGGAKFVVRPGCRRRVLAQKRKNVHAFVKGSPIISKPRNVDWLEVHYNPYARGYFFGFVDGHLTAVDTADYVNLKKDGTCWAGWKR